MVDLFFSSISVDWKSCFTVFIRVCFVVKGSEVVIENSVVNAGRGFLIDFIYGVSVFEVLSRKTSIETLSNGSFSQEAERFTFSKAEMLVF